MSWWFDLPSCARVCFSMGIISFVLILVVGFLAYGRVHDGI